MCDLLADQGTSYEADGPTPFPSHLTGYLGICQYGLHHQSFNGEGIVVDFGSSWPPLKVLPLRPPSTKIYINQVAYLHDILKSIVSNEDRLFVSKLWKELFRRNGRNLNMSTTPPQNGRSE